MSSSSDAKSSLDRIDGSSYLSDERSKTSKLSSLIGMSLFHSGSHLCLFFSLAVCFVGLEGASAQDLSIISPVDGACVAGVYTVSNPLEGGIINGNNFSPDPVSMEFSYTDDSGNFLDVKITASEVNPAFEQPPQALCPDWQFGDDIFEACGGRGYCNFTKKCSCFDDNDCDNGNGVCNSDGICGCANEAQCGLGQICDQGQCACADDSACAAGQECLDGACTCSVSEDCGEGLICSNGICSALGEGFTSFSFIDGADPSTLPRVITQTVQLPPDLQDSEGLALRLEVIDYNQPPPSIVATQTIGFKLDRAFPLLSTTDDCEDDADCTVSGESCDLVTHRCYPSAEANIGSCRPLDDFSQGLSADYALNDNFDDNPSINILEVVDTGCQRLQRFMLSDNCGNAQIVSAEGIRSPNQGELTINLEGYVCTSSPCERELTLNEGESSSRVNINSVLTAPDFCYDFVELTLDTLDDDGAILSSRPYFSDEVLEAKPASILSSREVTDGNGSSRVAHGGPFQLVAEEQLIFTYSDGSTETFTVRADDFFDLNAVAAIELVIAINRQTTSVYALLDGNDLRLNTRELGEGVTLNVDGTAASSLGFTAAFDSDAAVGSGDGRFRARADVYACGNQAPFASDQFSFSVSMPFEISIGGPYVLDEGDALEISAESVFVSESFGGIAKVEWDLDGDGQYEREERFLSPAELRSTRDLDGQLVHSGPFLVNLGETLVFTYADASEEIFTVEAQDFSNIDAQSGQVTASSQEIALAIGRQVSGVVAVVEGEGQLSLYTLDVGLGVSLTISGSAASALGFTGAQGTNFAVGSGQTVTRLLAEPNDDPVRAEEMLTVVSIDTSDQASFLVSLRVTTGLGETLETRTSITINDISPVCILPQATYNLLEGEVFVFNAPDTRAGGEADPIVSYHWSFGDGSTDIENSENSAQHVYQDEGEYTLSLTASDEDSDCPDVASALVIVGGVAPVIEGVGLAPETLETIEGQAVMFTSGQTRAGAASDPIEEYLWDFGYLVDGQRQTLTGLDLTAPSHTYNDDGDYNVCLSVRDSDDLVGPSCFIVTVEDLNPTPIWNADRLQANEGEAITFDWTGTVAGGVADPLTAVRWNFSDGSAPVNSDLNTSQYAHTFNGDGEFTVRLTAIDEDSETFYEGRVTILDVSPVSRFDFVLPEGENNAQEGIALTLDASASTPGAPTDPITRYRWDFGDGSQPQESNGPTVNHAWPDNGIYEVHCTAIDSDGSTSLSTLVINVDNVDPEVSITGTDSVEVASEFSLNLNVDDVSGDLPTTEGSGAVVEWDMGDGTILNGPSVSHSYQTEGSFTVSVHFFDGDGGEAEATHRVVVTAQLAELTDINITVELDQDGGTVDDPQAPIREFSDDEVSDDVYYLREGDEITLNVTVNSARLANGVLNPATFNWQVPEGARITDTPILPPQGEDGEGQEVSRSSVTWHPGFFSAGVYNLILSVNGESGGAFSRTWTFKVAERGTPMLATTTGSLRRGRVVLYRYDLTNNQLSFTPNREISVGRGAYDIIADELRHRLFVSSPLSGHVAVLGGDPLNLVRRIPTGAGAYDMDWGGGRVWVVNTESNTLSAIDPETLKVERHLELTGLERPLAVTYVSSNTFAPRLIVACGATGRLLVIHVQDMLSGLGEDAIEHTLELGGSLTQLAQYGDKLWIVDGKYRRLYMGSINTIAQTGNSSALTLIDGIPFAASDVVATERGLWVATGDELSFLDNDGFIEDLGLSVDRLIEAAPLLYPSGQSALVISDGERIEHKLIEENGDLSDSVGLNSGRLQRLTNFIQYLD